jgi:predicted outer membrane repeat protein
MRVWLLPVMLLASGVGDIAHASTCRVTIDGSSFGDGGSWSTQAMDLQTALTTSACTEIWVKGGLYKPTGSTDRGISFSILPGVAVYGGFAGSETLRGNRNPAANPTTLSGEIGEAGVGDNSYHVVVMDGTTAAGNITATTVLDGFAINGGNADAPSAPDGYGGGLLCKGDGGHACSPALNNLGFSGNNAYEGGAIYNNGTHFGNSSPVLGNVTFSANSASFNGGAMCNGSASSGTSSPALGNVTFHGNSAGNAGGAIYDDGNSGTSSPMLSNVSFSANSAFNSGGAMANDGLLGASTPTLVNVIAWGDFDNNGAEFFNTGGAAPTIANSVIHGGCTSGNTCTNVIDQDPLLGPLADNGGSTLTMLPGADSPAVDAGNDATCAASLVNGLDQRGFPRPQGHHCDIGAVEVVTAAAIVAVGGSGQQATIWADFFNPLLVQVHDGHGLVSFNARVYTVAPPATQVGASCTGTATTDDQGFAVLYCRANGIEGGPYAVKVYVNGAATTAPAVFLLSNSAGDGDLIFWDHFDPPGPPVSSAGTRMQEVVD